MYSDAEENAEIVKPINYTYLNNAKETILKNGKPDNINFAYLGWLLGTSAEWDLHEYFINVPQNQLKANLFINYSVPFGSIIPDLKNTQFSIGIGFKYSFNN